MVERAASSGVIEASTEGLVARSRLSDLCRFSQHPIGLIRHIIRVDRRGERCVRIHNVGVSPFAVA